jgi:hypothetical protein
MKHYKTNSCMSCAVFDQCTKKTKRKTYWTLPIRRCDLSKQNESKTIMKYTEDDKPLWNTYGVIKRQWGFIIIMTKKTIKHALPMWDWSLQLTICVEF